MKVFIGTSNADFGKLVCTHLKIEPSQVKISKFADGEINVVIEENVRQEDCFIIQSTGPSKTNSPNDNFMELLILSDALKRGSASSVNIVMPYYGYERQDRKDYSRAPISAKVVASCLEAQNIDRVITFDLHAGQIQGFFSNRTPFDNLYVESYFIKYITSKIIGEEDLSNVCIVSPDEGGTKRAVRIANKVNVSTCTIYKERQKANQISKMMLMGNVEGKICIMVDDIIDTAGTACKACDVLIENGASKVYMLACHGILSGNAIERINESKFEKVIISNTLDNAYKENMEKVKVIDVSWMCSEAMRRALLGQSLTELYESTIGLEL